MSDINKSAISKSGSATSYDLHIDTALTRVSVAYKQDESKYIANKVFPEVPVLKQSDKVWILDKNDLLRNETKKRAPGTESAGRGYALSTTDYFCDVYGIHADIPREYLANSDIPNWDMQVAGSLVNDLLIDRERNFITNMFTTDLWADQGTPNDATGHATNSTWPYFIYFSDGADSDPLGVIRTGKQKIQTNTGFQPNTLVVGQEVHDILALHPDIKELIKYTQTGIGDLRGYALMAQLLGVDNYLVGSAVHASNVEGATAAYAYTFGKNMLLCYTPKVAGLLQPASGYIFEWTGLSGLGYNVTMDKWWMREINSWRIEGEMAYDQKIVGSDLGLYFSGAVA